MNPVRHRYRLLVGLEIFALALFGWWRLVLEPRLEAGRTIGWAWGLLAALIVAVAALVFGSVRLYARVLASKVAEGETTFRESFVLSLAPSLFLFLTFGQVVISLRRIDGALVLFSVAGFFILQVAFLARVGWLPSARTLGDRIRSRIDAGKTASIRLPVAVFLITLVVYIIYNSGLVFPSQPLTGDEPHYALMAGSLLKDGDINLLNDYRDRKNEAFYPGPLDPHAVAGREGKAALYSRHFPALPLLMVPFYAAGEETGAVASRLSRRTTDSRNVLVFFLRFPVCLLAALLGLVFFLCARELTESSSAALASWLVFSFCAPMLFYSHLIYPEIPAALILAWIALALILKKRLSRRNLFFAGLGIGLLPWFALKYTVLSLAAFLVVLYLILRSGRSGWRAAAAFLGPILVSAGFYLGFLLTSFDTLSPVKIYLGAEAARNYTLFRSFPAAVADIGRRFFGLFFDQRAGLMVIAPVYALSFAGFTVIRERRPKESTALFVFLAVFWVFSSVTPYWGGYCPPGRPFIPVLWVFGLCLASAFSRSAGRVGRTIGAALIGLTLAMTFLGLRTPRLLYHEGLSSLSFDTGGEMRAKFLAGLSSILVDWTKLVPSLSARDPGLRDWSPLPFWLLAVLGITLAWLGKRRREGKDRSNGLRFLPAVAPVLAAGMMISVLALFHVRLTDGYRMNGGTMTVYPQDQNSFGEEEGGFWVRGKSKAFFIVRSAQPVAEFGLTLSSPVEGDARIRIGTEERRIRRAQPAGLPQTLTFVKPRGVRWKGAWLYGLEIEEKGGFIPYKIDRNSKDRRFLGVFVRLLGTRLGIGDRKV